MLASGPAAAVSAAEPARSAIVRTRKGIRTGAAMLPGLVLHEADGKYTQKAESVLRDGAALRSGD